jgi:hypothetical protein
MVSRVPELCGTTALLVRADVPREGRGYLNQAGISTALNGLYNFISSTRRKCGLFLLGAFTDEVSQGVRSWGYSTN